MYTIVYFVSILVLFLILEPLTGVARMESSVKYRHFEDYLSNLDQKDQMFLTREELEMDEGSGEIAETGKHIGSLFSRPLPIRTGSTRSKEVTCCMLGQLAGDKGYHCFVKFYAARILFRNYNRAQNKKIPSFRRHQTAQISSSSADKLMRTFGQCVATRGVIFHKCCHLEAMKRNPEKMRDQNKMDERKNNRIKIKL